MIDPLETSSPRPAASSHGSTEPSAPAARLGVGLLYNPALPDFLASDLDALDYLEVIPEMFWTDQGLGGADRFTEIEATVAVLDGVATERPVIAHSVGLSIGSADLFDGERVEQIARWHERYRFPWHSDHLSFLRMGGPDGHEINAGLAIPVPYDEEVLDLIASRVKTVQSRVAAPFLLENNVYYVDLPEQEMSEPEFLNRLAAETGCGLLLDVHNVHTNATNHGFDPHAFVGDLDLSRVIEVHIAGGNEFAGMYTDSHAGPCPEAVWELLARVVAGAPNLAGITFEFHASYFPLLGVAGIRRELDRAREVWARYGSPGLRGSWATACP
jgi:uncharacterized protein (UPF0276 family)